MSQLKKVFVHESKPVSAGAILTFSIPSYSTIDDILLCFKNSGAAATLANIKAAIDKVALSINGEQVINCQFSDLCDVYSSLGVEVTQNLVNCLGLNLGKYLFKDPSTEDFFAWGCADIQTIQVQVYCNASTTGVTDLEVSTVRRSTETTLGSYIKIINYPQSMGSAGTSVVDNLPRDANEGYLSIQAHADGGTITGGECVVNGNNIIDPISQSLNDYITDARGFSHVSGVFNYLFCDGSVKSGCLPMSGVTELRLKTVFTVAPTSGVYDLIAVSIKNIPPEMLKAISA